jgi:hypothetical protein
MNLALGSVFLGKVCSFHERNNQITFSYKYSQDRIYVPVTEVIGLNSSGTNML